MSDDDRDPPRLSLVGEFKLPKEEKPETAEPEEPPNVIKATFGKETRIADHGGFCWHSSILVHERTRSVTCATCNADLDPFDRLLEYARKERNYHHYGQREKALHDRIAKLEEEERKIKARTRNAIRKDADAAVKEALEKRAEAVRSVLWKAREITRLGEQIERLLGPKSAPAAVVSDEVLAERKRIKKLLDSYLHTAIVREPGHRGLTRAGRMLMRAVSEGTPMAKGGSKSP